ncbi:hypothetical protein MRY16398_p10060 (plasmid) [Phytobacter sp. MRY16-398]|nr:hypothetical protein MRY16398_p10060 [Phytobacter sp. MRY16-398]
MMSLWDALRMNMMISYQELVRTFLNADDAINALKTGNHVDFSFIQQGNISLLKSINVTQS